jgi:hypothetical protein
MGFGVDGVLFCSGNNDRKNAPAAGDPPCTVAAIEPTYFPAGAEEAGGAPAPPDAILY